MTHNICNHLRLSAVPNPLSIRNVVYLPLIPYLVNGLTSIAVVTC